MKTTKNIVIAILAIFVLTYLEWRIIGLVHISNLLENAQGTISPLNGHAWWRAWQNRYFAGSFMNAMPGTLIDRYQSSIFLFLIAANFATWTLYRKAGYPLILSVLLMILVQHPDWLYGWDILDFLFMTLMLIGIDRKLGLGYFTFLFALAISNRESALFIPLWILIDAIQKKSVRGIVSAGVMMALGVGLVFYLRQSFIMSGLDYAGFDSAHKDFGNWFVLFENLQHPFETFAPWKPSLSLVPAAVVGSFIYLTFGWKRSSVTEKKIIVFCISIIFSIYSFMYIHETRGWIILLPFLIYLSQIQKELK